MSKPKPKARSALAAWKARAVARLIELYDKYKDNQKAKQAIDSLIAQIQAARSIDLARIMSLMHSAAQEMPEIRSVIPSEDEVKAIFEDYE
jgi:thioredoxin-like negative regulator of GroEL